MTLKEGVGQIQVIRPGINYAKEIGSISVSEQVLVVILSFFRALWGIFQATKENLAG